MGALVYPDARGIVRDERTQEAGLPRGQADRILLH
jgi:hypothetical protein